MPDRSRECAEDNPAGSPARSGRLARLVRAFLGGREGTIAISLSLTLVPIMTVIGAGVDLGVAARAKARLDAAADVAALSAVNKTAILTSLSSAQARALSTFAAQSGATGATVTSNSAEVTDSGFSRTAVVSYTATVPTSILGVVGLSAMQITGSAKAMSNMPTYIDFYLLLDNTPSMGVGATPQDIATLVTATAKEKTDGSCGFACHIAGSTTDRYALAKKLGVTMRIDVVRQATQRLMDTATVTQTVPSQFRAAIYTHGASCTQTGFTTITPLTASLSAAKTAASAIDLMTIPYQGYNNDQCTDNTGVLAAVNLAIATPGDGTSAAAPQKVLFLVSDGVTDAYYPSTCTRTTTSGRCQEPLNPAACDAIKARGIKIAVLYTTYNPLPTNSWYNTWIAPFQSTIGTKMQACASAGLYFEVSPTQGISEAMTALFQRAVTMARLTS